ncbi:MAG TPA: hypothetical protein VFZ65_11320 [Planctomycetota bacterium]|nr:hypothetical protein [Planctomycetota bacterium]
MPAAQRWFRRLLSLCPVLIAVLWLAGVSQFRNYDLGASEWGAIIACAFALHVITRRLRRERPLPPLPENSNPATLAALAAAIVAFLAMLVGGALEWFVQPYYPSDTSWALRTTWHAACAFGASYCGFLLTLLGHTRKLPPPA